MKVRDINTLLALMHYDGYLDKQQIEVERFKQLEKLSIARGFDYLQVQGLSIECRQRLMQAQPMTLGQASRLSGITPAAITSLMMYLRQKKHVE
jgi:tRNA uridine 5-carboxymethylaminomethyl modification enzyme